MNAEIIAVGTELLLGQILNTNAMFLSQHLATLGIDVYYQTVVGDNNSRLQQAIEVAQERADILIFTGGLGPTKDDLTKETIAKTVGTTLVYDEHALQSITDYFLKTGREFTENNKKQALVLEGATVFPNDQGMAPGMGLLQGGKMYILLPGPPKEMRPMYTNYVQPFLMKKSSNEVLYSRVLRFFGIGESQLEHHIQDIIDGQTNPTIAPLAADGEVTLRLTAKHHAEEEAQKLLDETEQSIYKRVGEFLYGYNEEALHTKAVQLLQENQFTIASAESVTGGFFGERLTEIQGVSSIYRGGVICYQNEIKEQILHVPHEVLVTEGAVSGTCAKIMAEQVRALFQTDVGISFTGVAGPDELEGKKVGTVYIGIALPSQPTIAVALQLGGSRLQIRERAIKYGFYHLYKMLEKR